MKRLALVSLVSMFAIGLVACSSGEESDPPLELSAGEGGGAMASCIVFDPAILSDAPIAFEGTATAVEGDEVTLDVDRWFKGGESDEVVLRAPQGLQALIGGIEFEEGKQYLISAVDGHVNYCGYSGEVTPELEAGFEAAFPS